MMAAMATVVRAISALRLASEAGLFGGLGFAVTELAGGLITGAAVGAADGVGAESTAAATNATGLAKPDAGGAVRTGARLIAGAS
jgi:hypothetical protein